MTPKLMENNPEKSKPIFLKIASGAALIAALALAYSIWFSRAASETPLKENAPAESIPAPEIPVTETAPTNATTSGETAGSMSPDQTAEEPVAPVSQIPAEPKATSIQGRAGYLYDITAKKILYSKDADEVLPLASLTKVMTAYTALKEMSESDPVVITDASLAKDGDNGLIAGETWKLGDLLRFTLIVSSNDGAEAIAEAYDSKYGAGSFGKAMNLNAQALGFSDMYFLNPTGLDENPYSAGGFGSARDIAGLFVRAVDSFPDVFHSTIFASQSFASEQGYPHTAHNTDLALPAINDPIASKTGNTYLAGGNLALEFRMKNGDRVIAVVLGSSQEGRFRDIKTLVSAAARLAAGE